MNKTHILSLFFAMLCTALTSLAQTDTLYSAIDEPWLRQWQIDTTKTEELSLELNSTLFFRDNEISTPIMRGYTLPGFRLRPSVSYQPNNSVKVEMGLYMFRFWGTDVYPNMSYSDISYWTGGEKTTRGFHLLPFFRVQMATKGGFNFVLGSIYGGRMHRLIEPLYAPELNLIADPEAGAQILYSNRWLDFDTWVNWESFIYKNDTHQEAFTFGVSSKIKYNREISRVHVYSPIQILFQHRGGEIDTLLNNSVQTLFNGSAGIGATLNFKQKTIKRLTMQVDGLLYNQQVGDIWPFKNGLAYYIHSHIDVSNAKIKLGYFHSHKFISLFGYPFFGNVSISDEGLTFANNSTLLAGIDYNYELAPGYILGANAVIFQHLATDGIKDGVVQHFGPSTSYCGSLYFRINPSFLLRSFRK